MTKQVTVRRQSSPVYRRCPLLDGQDLSSRGPPRITWKERTEPRKSSRMAEVVGGTAAECAVVCCCCPCGLVNLLILVIFKVPAGLCLKALRRTRRRRPLKQGLLQPPKCGCDETELQIHSVATPVEAGNAIESSDKDVFALEKEMWDQFPGFWRSPFRDNIDRVQR